MTNIWSYNFQGENWIGVIVFCGFLCGYGAYKLLKKLYYSQEHSSDRIKKSNWATNNKKNE